MVIVASERLSPVMEDWLEVPDNHILQVMYGRAALLLGAAPRGPCCVFSTDLYHLGCPLLWLPTAMVVAGSWPRQEATLPLPHA